MKRETIISRIHRGRTDAQRQVETLKAQIDAGATIVTDMWGRSGTREQALQGIPEWETIAARYDDLEQMANHGWDTKVLNVALANVTIHHH